MSEIRDFNYYSRRGSARTEAKLQACSKSIKKATAAANARTPEERALAARKAWETKRANGQANIPLTREEQSEKMRCAWETRRRNMEERKKRLQGQ